MAQNKGFTDEERAAMRERAKEAKAARGGKADGEADLLAMIGEMPEFSDSANLDKGEMWPTSFALRDLASAEEKKIAALVKRAVS